MPKPNPYFFLLGGYDLEMVEIRKLMECAGLAEGADFMDYSLSWSEARLSRYAEVFHPSRINVGVELAEDRPPPPRYLRIDHHNHLQHLPASIIQVAKLLGQPLSRFQLLVAANDCQYIPGLVAAGASEEEIQHIRWLDRQAQGVTAADEALAQLSIDQHLVQQQGTTLVKALTPRFSAISDRLFAVRPHPWIIYSDAKLVYYGPGADRLALYFDEWIRKGLAYSGGGSAGYFGLDEHAFTPQEIQKLPQRILNYLSQSIAYE